jgi:hypothetical protein
MKNEPTGRSRPVANEGDSAPSAPALDGSICACAKLARSRAVDRSAPAAPLESWNCQLSTAKRSASCGDARRVSCSADDPRIEILGRPAAPVTPTGEPTQI